MHGETTLVCARGVAPREKSGKPSDHVVSLPCARSTVSRQVSMSLSPTISRWQHFKRICSLSEKHINSMPFPIQPEHGDGLSQFLIQDPFTLRKQILPVLTVDKNDSFLTGLGTAFRVDPFGTFVTAEHVLKDHFEKLAEREVAVATVLYGMGLVYGMVGLRSEYFAPIREALMWRTGNPEPAPLIGSKELPRIVADVLRFHPDGSNWPGPQARSPLPIRLLCRRLKVAA